jgi:hypothetical protein
VIDFIFMYNECTLHILSIYAIYLIQVQEKYGKDVNIDRLRGKFLAHQPRTNSGDQGDGGDRLDADGSSSSSSSDTEDEDGEEMTPAMDIQLFRTIAAIRRRDRAVYEKNHSFFDGIYIYIYTYIYIAYS